VTRPLVSVAVVVFDIAVALALFVGLFVGLFWTPGFVLFAFAFVLAADSRMLSQAAEYRQRRQQVRAAARPYRGGWLDSPPRR